MAFILAQFVLLFCYEKLRNIEAKQWMNMEVHFDWQSVTASWVILLFIN